MEENPDASPVAMCAGHIANSVVVMFDFKKEAEELPMILEVESGTFRDEAEAKEPIDPDDETEEEEQPKPTPDTPEGSEPPAAKAAKAKARAGRPALPPSSPRRAKIVKRTPAKRR